MLQRIWKFLGNGKITDHCVFRLRRYRYRFEPTGEERDFVVIDSASWVNVVPLTTEGNVVLIRQFRHGIRDVVLEIPGGMIDGDEAPAAAAARELREETGYLADNIRLLARVLPNPAVQNNFLYLFAAEGCRNTGGNAAGRLRVDRSLGAAPGRHPRHDRQRRDRPQHGDRGVCVHGVGTANAEGADKMTTSSTKVKRGCPACGSEKIIPNTYLSGVYQFLFEGNPAAFMLKEPKGGNYVGELCGDCGVITLRAEDPAKMWEEYQQTVEGRKNATMT